MKILKDIQMILAGVFIGSCFLPTIASGEGVDNICKSADRCEVPVSQISTQATDPFLFLGREMNSEHPRWRQYRRALRRFPSALDCLVAEEQAKATPNLIQIDWDYVKTGSNLHVCMFRIGRTLSNIEDILTWLTFHEFRTRGVQRVASDNYVPRFPNDRVANLTAWWTIEQYRELNPSLLGQITGIELLLSFQLVLGFNEENQLVGVSSVTPSK